MSNKIAHLETNEVEIGDLPWECWRERKERRRYFIREKAIILRICEVIDYFIIPLHLWSTYFNIRSIYLDWETIHFVDADSLHVILLHAYYNRL